MNKTGFTGYDVYFIERPIARDSESRQTLKFKSDG